ncbi:O-antigen ligase family protein [Segatella copri]|uniref:O-antigen ligase family protein n=1 Tax=Segatella copri TaxID=165179 RepID=UPI00294B8715|nr:O-antigen ligase family protein [Segatella copri]WOF88956.1 O-antigen ligase family protein [Segatella copri]WOF95100.1 O-antigen ligase family protein [Segatella copri]
MLLSKGKIITAYYYIALIAFALSACAVMFEQESSGGIAYTNFIIAFAFMVWSVFVLRPFTKDYLIEIPSKTIIFFNFYMTWVLLVTAINPVGVKGISSYLNSLFWSAFPILILNSTYYFVLHKGDSRWLKIIFLVITALFLLTYYSFYDVDNILMNVHLGSSYYSLYMLPLVLVYPSKIGKTCLTIIVSLAVFSSVKRGGVLALALAMIAYIITNQLVSKQGKFKKIIIGFCVLTAFIAIFAYIGTMGDNNIFERFESIQEDNGSGRTDVWAEAWRLITEQGIFTYFVGNGFNTVVHNSRYVLSAHNDYLEAWFDFGLIGMLLYIISLCLLFKDIFECLKTKKEYAPAMSVLGALIIVLTMISHIAIYYWFNVIVLCIAYFEGRYNREKRQLTEKEEDNE